MNAGGQVPFQRHSRLCTGLAVCLVVVLWRVAGASEESVSSPEAESVRRQVRYLTDSLAEARAQVDALKARLDRSEFDRISGSAAAKSAETIELGEKEYRILEFNRELGIAVLNAGHRQGLRPGLQFAVMHKNKVAATVKVVDVRDAIAGAVIQRTSGGEPRAQDRAVLMPGSRE